jgi:predicted nucleic acid-binding protein
MRINQFLNLIPLIVDFERQAAVEFGKIQGELRKQGKPTGERYNCSDRSITRRYYCYK